MRNESRGMRRGFTLIEMLVVIGILAILIGIGLNTFSSSTAKAQKARGQELVSNVATALEAIYQREGCWPRRILANGNSDGLLDENVAYDLAKRGVITLTYDENSRKTTGLDRFGVVSPWALDAIKKAGTGASTGTRVPSGKTVRDHILHYAVDDDGDGKVTASVGGNSVTIRGTVAVWCGGMDGEISPYKVGGGASGQGGGGENTSSKKSGSLSDIYSWTYDQVEK